MSVTSALSPKVSFGSSDKARRWYRFYAMFSEEFALNVIRRATLDPLAIVLDPWLGVGTTTAAAASFGLKSYGVDINPVMVQISRGRCAQRDRASAALADASKAMRGRPQLGIGIDPLLKWFGPRAAGALRGWSNMINGSYSGAEAGFLYTAVFEAAWSLAAAYRSKNPTWIKEPAAEERVEVGAADIRRLVMLAGEEKLVLCPADCSSSPELVMGTSTHIDLPAASVDFVLTSPPYCTRIDYAMATRLELAILGEDSQSLAQLRSATMGSSTIRESAGVVKDAWGETCVQFLRGVAEHPSKGSATYYLKTHLQYFSDLYNSLFELDRCLKRGGRAVLVVQDSCYKGLHTDLAQICHEMGRSFGWSLIERQDHSIARSMRTVNTRSLRYGGIAPTESVLWFCSKL